MTMESKFIILGEASESEDEEKVVLNLVTTIIFMQ